MVDRAANRPSSAARRLMPIFLAVAAITIASTLLVYWMGLRVTAANQAIIYNQEIIAGLDDLLSTLKDAETGQRGYLLTNDEKYLQPYNAAVQRVGSHLEQLDHWAQTGDVASDWAKAAARLTQEKLDELKQTIETRRQKNLEAAKAIVQSDVGKRIMDDLRAQVKLMVDRERTELDASQKQRDAASSHRTLIMLGTALVTLAFLIWAFRRIRQALATVERQVSEQKAAERALRKSESRLSFALQTSQTGYWDLDLIDHTAHRSLLHDRLFGYETPLPQWTYEMFLEHVVPQDREMVDGKFKAAVAAQGDWSFECRIVRADKALRWIAAAGQHQRDESGQARSMTGTVRDITEAKRAEEMLRESEQRLRTMVDAIPQLAWTAHADGFIHWYNRRWYEYTGTTPQQMEGWGWQRVHDPQTLPAVLEQWKVSLATGEPFDMVFPLRGADGIFRRFLTRVVSLKDQQGRVVQWFGTNTDVDELKRAEEAQSLLAAIVESSDDAILSKGLDGTILSWNAGAQRLFGYRADEIIGKPVAMLLPPERVQEEEQILARLGRGERIEHYETVRVTRDGKQIEASVTVSPVKDRKGRVVGASKIVRDITERKRVEKALRQSEERYRTLFSSLLEGFCVIEVLFDADERPNDYRFLEINPAFEAQTGLHDAQGKRMRELAPEHEAHWFEIYGQVALTGEPTRFVNEARAMNRWYDVSAYRVGGPDSRKVAILFSDITEVKRAEQALQRTAEELARSNKDLEQFAYVASHDLQEPLRMVTGYLQLIDGRYRDKLDQDAREFIGFAVDGATRMSRLISDLLDYSRIHTRGKRPEPVPMEAALRRAVENLQAAICESEAQITHGPLPTIRGDSSQLVQLFQNLVGNAIKFRSPDRPVQVYVGAEKRDDEWIFSVKDNGIGIEPQYADKIFLIFQRLHSRGEYPGTGIGLAICKRIVERHGGRIWVESQSGQGSTFFFTIRNPRMTR